jgi:ADP-heptose:LPS heptosyltransferase
MIKNILILNMTRMGDLVQSTPSIIGLRKKYPNACVTLMVTSAFEEFSKKIPCVNKTIVFDINQFIDIVNEKKILWVDVYHYLEDLLDKLKDNKYDLVINFSHSKLSALMISYLKVINIRGFGCDDNGDRMTFDPWMQYFGIEPFNRQFNPFNLVEIFTRSAGVAPEDNPIHLLSKEVDIASILKIEEKGGLNDKDILIGVQAGSSLEGRRWNPESFAKLIDGLVENLGAKIVLFGVNSEKELAEKIILSSNHGNKIIDLTGETNIDQLTELIARCTYLITNDTGTMHVAAAVGTTIIGLFFAHAHPYETAPYSSGHLIFQARIPCAPCGYGVQCNNIICVRKVYPEYLLEMIRSHFLDGSWRTIDAVADLSEVNIYETYLGKDKRLRLRPLIKNLLTLNDFFREIYSEHWMRFLGEEGVDECVYYNIADILMIDYDCSNIINLSKKIEVKSRALKDVIKFSLQGVYLVNKINSLCSDKIPAEITKIEVLSKEIDFLDERINQIGLFHPEIKPVTDMFAKRKENFQGNDLIQLSQETRNCYQMLQAEGESLNYLLVSVSKELHTAHVNTFHTDVSSMSVEVPGR